MRPWDPSNDLLQYEYDYGIKTWTKHKTPVVRTCSIASLDQQPLTPSSTRMSAMKRASVKRLRIVGEEEESESSSHELEIAQDSDSSERHKGKRM